MINYLRICIDNKIMQPIYLEVQITDELAKAFQASPITNSTFLIYQKIHGLVVPFGQTKGFKIPDAPKGKLNDYKIGGN